MNKLSLLCFVLFGLFTFSSQQTPPQFVDYLDNVTTTVIFGAGVDGVQVDVDTGEVEAISVEFTELSPRDPNEWTFEVVTQDGEVYTFVDDDGNLGVLGPDGLNEDVSQAYAEWAGIEDWESADVFGEWVIATVDHVYDEAGVEQID